MEKKIIEMIAEKLGKKPEELKPEQKLVEDLGADSLDLVELVMTFEDEFGISLPDEDVDKLKTIKDIVDYISKLKK
ncbi:MAG: acyl carrier protein [Candidatus Onthoplasma sp.]